MSTIPSVSGVNVLRYSCLALGVVYGFYHQRRIRAAERTTVAQQEYDRQAKLIQQAKAEFNKTKQPANPRAAGVGSGGDLDIMSPNFDFESFIESLAEVKT